MKSNEYKEVKEKLDELKKSIPYLEAKIKTKNKKEIENSIAYLVYILHKMHREATGKSTEESIQDFSNHLWWFKMQKDKERKIKIMKVDEIYNFWSKNYDSSLNTNLPIFLEEKKIKNYLPKVKDKEVLDLGCGTGRYSIPLAKKGAKVTGIDFTRGMLDIAKKKAKEEKLNIEFKQGDITKYASDKKFDLIISMLVLDHIKNLKDIVNVMNNASKIGTEVIISNIHPDILKKSFDPETGEYRGYLLEGKDTARFYRTLSEYIETFLGGGFVLTKIDNLVFEKKYWKIKRFKSSLGIRGENLAIIMKFRKIK
jgi:ubiquinone biosynthesis O-methyltransferase